jgi:hypothetical protein
MGLIAKEQEGGHVWEITKRKLQESRGFWLNQFNKILAEEKPG